MLLRHKPETIGLALDEHGWAEVDELLLKLKKTNRKLTREELEEIVTSNDKKRFTLSPDKNRIRAAQGHSFDIDLGLSPKQPPQVLYHGTARSNLDSIFVSGLEGKGRNQVHLSADEVTAFTVGSRHGKPVVLSIDVRGMLENDHKFYQADNGVWLTDSVPSKFLGFAQSQHRSDT